MDADERERLLEKLRQRRASPRPPDLARAVSSAINSGRLSGMDPFVLEDLASLWKDPKEPDR